MRRKYHQKMLIAAFAGFLMFYCLFSFFSAIVLMASSPWTAESIPLSIVFTIVDGLYQLPLGLLTGFPLFLVVLAICTKITSRFYLSLVCHALLAVPLSGLILASDMWVGPHIVEDWHNVFWLAARWVEASLPSGAVGGLTSWALRPPFSREKSQAPI